MRRIRQNYVNLINIAFSACVMNIFIGTRDKSTDCDRSTIFTLSNKVSTHKSHYSVSYCPWCKLIWPHFYAGGLHFGPCCIVFFVIFEKIRSQTKDNTSGFTILPKNTDLSRVTIKIFITHAEKAIFVKFT